VAENAKPPDLRDHRGFRDLEVSTLFLRVSWFLASISKRFITRLALNRKSV
jgi:hypothetical protein